MYKKFSLLCLTLLSYQATAEQSNLTTLTALQEGSREFAIGGSFDADYSDDYLIDFNASYGYFIFDHFEVGTEVDLSMSDHTEAYEVGVFAEYNFELGSSIVPYIGLGSQYVSSETLSTQGHEDAFNFQTALGIKYFVHPQIALTMEANYNLATEDVYVDGDGTLKDNKTKFILGTRFYF